MLQNTKKKYSRISSDITNYCNARCLFCFNDWDRFPQKHNMDAATFNKIFN